MPARDFMKNVAIYCHNNWQQTKAPDAFSSPTYPHAQLSPAVHYSYDCSYDALREVLGLLSLDKANYGTAEWNPLGALITPGDHVLLKPNLIRESHATNLCEWDQVITHPFVINAILHFVFIALKGRGKVTIADGPQTDSDFDEIVRRTHLDDTVTFFKNRGLDIQLVDLRRDRWLQKGGITYERIALTGDPAGYTAIHLNESSEFTGYKLSGKFYGADYDISDTAKYHSDRMHAYILCRTPLDADVLINIPKMKTHKKTGVTLSLKNLVGINGYRNCLPHHTIGAPDNGGDEFPKSKVSNRVQSQAIVAFKKILATSGNRGGVVARLAMKIGRNIFGDTSKVIRSGNWYGNDTAWRMVLDLNKALFHFNGSGQRRMNPIKYMSIVDGIIAGEGNGPVDVDKKPCGVVLAGFNPVAVDTACATIMGFNYEKIPMVANAWVARDLPLVDFKPEDVRCASNVKFWNGTIPDLMKSPHLSFQPHFGWRNHIER